MPTSRPVARGPLSRFIYLDVTTYNHARWGAQNVAAYSEKRIDCAGLAPCRVILPNKLQSKGGSSYPAPKRIGGACSQGQSLCVRSTARHLWGLVVIVGAGADAHSVPTKSASAPGDCNPRAGCGAETSCASARPSSCTCPLGPTHGGCARHIGCCFGVATNRHSGPDRRRFGQGTRNPLRGPTAARGPVPRIVFGGFFHARIQGSAPARNVKREWVHHYGARSGRLQSTT